ncbi:MAG: class I SAM-dependent methyltransferase [Aquisalimonadaceae bacterium]
MNSCPVTKSDRNTVASLVEGLVVNASNCLRKIIFPFLCTGTRLVEFIVAVICFYPNTRFLRVDMQLSLSYFALNPYRICENYLKDWSSYDVQKVYGETFLTTLASIGRAVNLSEKDVVYELGCGRGRCVFWFNAFYKCRTIGVDINPVFIDKARRIKSALKFDNVEFKLASIMDVRFDDATIIYLYGTAFEDHAVERLVERFSHLTPGTRVVSVSYPLTAYMKEPLFELEQELAARFLWGYTTVYVQRKLPANARSD